MHRCTCRTFGAERKRLAAHPLLPALAAFVTRMAPGFTARQLASLALFYGGLRSLDPDTAHALDAAFCRVMVLNDSTLDLASIAKLLDGFRESGHASVPSRELLGHAAKWLVAAGEASKAAAEKGASPAGERAVVGPPQAASQLLRAWIKEELPLPAVWALVASAAARAGAARADSSMSGRRLCATLHSLARLVVRARRSIRPNERGEGRVPSGLEGAIARWASQAVARISPAGAHARQDLGHVVWSLHVLGVPPDAATAADVVGKVAAVAQRVRKEDLRILLLMVGKPLEQWHRLGLVPDVTPAAKAFAARAAELVAACEGKQDLGNIKRSMTVLAHAAKLPVPPSRRRSGRQAAPA